MTKGSVCFYFGSKEAVLLELLNQAEQIVTAKRNLTSQTVRTCC